MDISDPRWQIFDRDRNFFARPLPEVFDCRSRDKWDRQHAEFMRGTGLSPKGFVEFKRRLMQMYKDEAIFSQEAKTYFATSDGRIALEITKDDFRRLTHYCEDEATRQVICLLTEDVPEEKYVHLVKEYVKFQVSQLRDLLDTERLVSIAFDGNLMSIFVMLQLPSGFGRVAAFKGTEGNLELVFFKVSEELSNVLEGISSWSSMHLPPGECSNPACESRFPQLKCKSCGVRYCQEECQKAHWDAHKEACSVKERRGGADETLDVQAGMAAMHVSNPCVVCGQENARRCCDSAYFCGTECQAKLWKQHKRVCSNSKRKARDSQAAP
jgi:hypothetical protein